MSEELKDLIKDYLKAHGYDVSKSKEYCRPVSDFDVLIYKSQY